VGLGRVRVIGVDTPELHAPEEPCGRAASAFVERLLRPGARVRLEVGEEARDRYGRLLADVRLPDGRLLALVLARRGLARQLTIEPNDRYASELAAAVERARSAGRGVWGGRCAT
jgi:micrococcal nuclease